MRLLSWFRRPFIGGYTPIRRPVNVVDPELVARIEATAAQLKTASNVLPLHGPEWRKRQRRRAATELWGGDPAA